jgi:two-component system sensor histidine kinase VicK
MSLENPTEKVVETVPMFFFIWDIDKQETVFISDSFYDERKKSYYRPERSKSDLRQYISKESEQAYDTFFARLSSKNFYHDQIELKAADNLENIEWMRLETYPIIEDEVKQVVGHIRDISYSRKEYQLMRGQVESLDTVTFLLSHELSAPITNMMGLADFLKSHVLENAEFKKYLHLYNTIHNFGGEALTIIRGLVSLLELQKLPVDELEKETVDIKALVEKEVSDFYYRNEDKAFKIECKKYGYSSQSRCHPKSTGKSHQRDTTLPGQNEPFCKPVFIELESSPDKQDVLIFIYGQNLKLPEKSLIKALERSHRLNLDDVQGKKLSGMLELILAKEIIELHEGRLIFYQNEENDGFQLQLPAVSTNEG